MDYIAAKAVRIGYKDIGRQLVKSITPPDLVKAVRAGNTNSLLPNALLLVTQHNVLRDYEPLPVIYNLLIAVDSLHYTIPQSPLENLNYIPRKGTGSITAVISALTAQTQKLAITPLILPRTPTSASVAIAASAYPPPVPKKTIDLTMGVTLRIPGVQHRSIKQMLPKVKVKVGTSGHFSHVGHTEAFAVLHKKLDSAKEKQAVEWLQNVIEKKAASDDGGDADCCKYVQLRAYIDFIRIVNQAYREHVPSSVEHFVSSLG